MAEEESRIDQPSEIEEEPRMEPFEIEEGQSIAHGGSPYRRLEYAESPIPEVRLMVSTTDNTELEPLTIRTWVIGLTVCVLQQYFRTVALFKDNALDIPMIITQFFALGAGHLMAAYLPNRVLTVPWIGFQFNLNPGPFNHKENALICIFGYVGRIRSSVFQTIAIVKGYWKKDVNVWVALTTMLSSNLISFFFVGVFMSWVSSPDMWWPSELVDVVFFSTWHEEYDGSMGRITNQNFFKAFFLLSFIYHIIPGFILPEVPALSLVCWLWKKSVMAQQLGSGQRGLGLFSFSFDWSSMSDFTGDPLTTPRKIIYNVMAGFYVALYLVIPCLYWANSYQTKKFPIFSTELFDDHGNNYNISAVLHADGLTFDKKAYEEYTPVHLSASAIISYSFMFASVASSLVHVVLNFGRGIWKHENEDVHNGLMRSYEPLPRSWLFIVSTVAFALAGVSCIKGFGTNISFPFSGLLISCILAMLLIPPLGIFAATTNQMIPVNVVGRLLGGFLYPNKPLQYMIFTNYTFQTTANAVSFLGFLKLGHYMKIGLRKIFLVLVVASIVSSLVGFGVTWHYVHKNGHICAGDKKLPVGSTGSCPVLDTVYSTTNMWGFLGSRRIIQDGNYTGLIVASVVVFSIADGVLWWYSPEWELFQSIKLPVILGALKGMPPGGPANMNSWLLTAFGLPWLLGKYIGGYSSKHQYLVSVALATGMGAISIAVFTKNLIIPSWRGLFTIGEQCPLAKCPTAPGVRVDGCPYVLH